MKTLFKSHNVNAEKAYIIRIENEVSKRMADRCADSCKKCGMLFEFWEGYNGIENPIKPPEHLLNDPTMSMIKLSDPYMTRTEIACALSHISLWVKCAVEDKPLVILEHDAIMLKKYSSHIVYNSICYLGCMEQVKKGWKVLPTPPFATEGPNNYFICRAHAYAIDSAVARSMVAYVIKYGINNPLDILIKADIFPIHQNGIFAYDESEDENTTIINRPKNGRNPTINKDLAL